MSTTTRTRLKPVGAPTVPVTLAARREISPSFVRLTLTGDGLDDYQFTGCDQWFRLFLPTEEAEAPRTLPDMGARSIAAYTLSRPSRRPLIRNYTTADYRPARPGEPGSAELDLDVYVDDSHTGPGLSWATGAVIGSAAALLDEGRLYAPPEDSDTELLVGDESALPAIAGILRDAPGHLRGYAVVEVGDRRDVRELAAPPGVETAWAVRGDAEPGSAATEEVHRRGVPAGLSYAYLAGRNTMVTGLRRHLVREHGVGKDRVAFTGYWR